MSTFSERHGYVKPKSIQFESMDDDLKNGIWNAIQLYFLRKRRQSASDFIDDDEIESIFSVIWIKFLKLPIDTMHPHWENLVQQFRIQFFKFSWHQVYTLLELLATLLDKLENGNKGRFEEYCNSLFESEVSGWRFVDGVISPITNAAEIQSVESAIQTPLESVNEHVRSALESLSLKPEPDTRKCVSESFHAIESLAIKTLGLKGKSLGDLMPDLKKELELHGAFSSGISQLWGWASDVARHSKKEDYKLSVEEAKCVLVLCSSVTIYLIQRAISLKKL
jgi:hypothetical protein